MFRLAVVSLGEDVHYVDTDVRHNHADTWQIVMVTDQRVVLATVTGGLGGTVLVETWARSALRKLAIEQDEEFQFNTIAVWEDNPDMRFPKNAAVALSYDGRDKPLTLPMPGADAPQRDAFFGLLPKLLADLG